MDGGPKSLKAGLKLDDEGRDGEGTDDPGREEVKSFFQNTFFQIEGKRSILDVKNNGGCNQRSVQDKPQFLGCGFASVQQELLSVIKPNGFWRRKCCSVNKLVHTERVYSHSVKCGWFWREMSYLIKWRSMILHYFSQKCLCIRADLP